jgi:hypothetical protein
MSGFAEGQDELDLLNPRLPFGRSPTSPGSTPLFVHPDVAPPFPRGEASPSPTPNRQAKGDSPFLGVATTTWWSWGTARGGVRSTLRGSALPGQKCWGDFPAGGLQREGAPGRVQLGQDRPFPRRRPGPACPRRCQAWGPRRVPRGCRALRGRRARGAPARGALEARGGAPDARAGSFLLDGLGPGTPSAAPTPSQCQGVG